MSTSIGISAAESLDELVALVEQYYRFDGIPFDRPVIRQGLLALMKNPSLGRAWILRNAERAVGYIALGLGFDAEFGGRDATITDLFIVEDHRGLGLGRLALATVEEFCRAERISALHLHVVEGNDRALRFYQRYGFERQRRIPMSKTL